MARYLLVEVDSNSTAERLMRQINRADAAKGMRVIAAFRKPTQLCECTPERPNHLHTAPDCVIGDRFRWWICKQCRKPRAGMGQTLWNMLDELNPLTGAYDQKVDTRHRHIHLGVQWVLNTAGEVRTRVTGGRS